MKRFILSILILLTSVCSVNAQTYGDFDERLADSLRQCISVEEGDALRFSLATIIDYYFLRNIDSALLYLDILEEIEIAQGNSLNLVINARAEIFSSYKMYDEYISFVNEELPSLKEKKAYFMVFNLQEILTDIYYSRGMFNEALQTAQTMYEDAKEIGKDNYCAIAGITLAELYIKSNRPEEACYFTQEAIQHLMNINPANSFDLLFKSQRLSSAMHIEMLAGKNEEAIELGVYMLDYLAEGVEKYRDPEVAIYARRNSFDACALMANAYINLQQFDDAKKWLDESMQYYTDNQTPDYLNIYYAAWYAYCMHSKDYEKALYYVDLLYNNTAEDEAVSRNDILMGKAEVLLRMEQYKESASLYEHCVHVGDSLKTGEFDRQLSDLRIKYETAEKENKILEQQISLQKTRQILLIVAILLAAFIIVAILVWRYNRRITEKNKKLVAHITQLSKQEKEIGVLKEATEEVDKSDEAILFSKLEQLMQEKMLFLNPDISREDIAKELNTNDFYLRAAIKAATELSFGAYIHRLQLEYAKDLLISDHSNSRAVKDIAYSSGFNSLTTFNRLFKEVYGLSAGEFRRISVKFPEE
ncbi:helix-turn-helix transcriptional regulator [Bacteroidales bacterium OttesenSCG-928-K22]|nr:helix-turn-helix transcriptional regulator [Bacteroidales bacterium OttesenSCG-928-L14]MDL2240885.1 helix-turn-helix transcriptional regulator [Bacteroidales bacterium OttesenSCG-928-K22]